MLETRDDITVEMAAWHSRDFARVRDAWDYLATVDIEAPVFNYREWFELACEAGTLTLWGALVLYRHSRPIALFPVCHPSPWCWQVASCFGNGNMQILVDPMHDDVVWQALASWLARTSQIGVFALGATEHRERVIRFRDACLAERLLIEVQSCAATDVWTPLPRSWEAFEQQIGPSAVKHLRRANRRLLHYYPGYTMDFHDTPAACNEALTHLIRLYRQRWGHRNLRCFFNDPRNIAFYQRAVAWAVRRGLGLVSVLRIDGQPVAAETLFRVAPHGALFMHICARDTTLLCNRFSPGIVEESHVFRWAIDQGISSINQGLLAMPYKKLFGGIEYPRWEISVARSRWHQRTLPALNRGIHLARRFPVHAAYHLGKPWDRSTRHTADVPPAMPLPVEEYPVEY